MSAVPGTAGSGGVADSAEYFLDIHGRSGKIKGECTQPGHEDDIQVRSWGWGVQASSSLGSARATQRRTYRNMTVLKYADKASTGLMSALANNDEISLAKLTLRRAGGGQHKFMVVELKQARITGIDCDGDDAGRVLERLTIAFKKISVTYAPQLTSGRAGAESEWVDEIPDA